MRFSSVAFGLPCLLTELFYKYSQNFLSVIISDLDVILLSNIIHDIHNIFSVVYRPLSYPMAIFIKINVFRSKIFIVYLATVLSHEITIFNQSHRIAKSQKYLLGVPGSCICLEQKIQLTILSSSIITL